MKITVPVRYFPSLRLLPMTMIAMALLLAMKSVHLVYAATGASPANAAVAPPAKAEPSVHTERSEKPKPEGTVTPTTEKAALPVVTPAEPAVSESERSLLMDLRQRRQLLDARETALVDRESTLAAVERRLAGRMLELTGLQSRLEALERQRRERDEGNWRGLVKLYEAMKPRDAALIFNDLDLSVLLPVMDRMKEAKAALVLSAMLPDRARLVTTELAQMRTKANTPAPGLPAPPSNGG